MTSGIVVPGVDIRVNGSRIPPAAEDDLRSVSVVEDLNALSMFTVVLYNWDPEKLAVSWSDAKLFAIGADVRISLGTIDDLHPVMTGEITSLEPTFSADEPPTLTVRGYDHRHRLARSQKTRTFSKMKDSAIASQVARAAGLRSQVQDTKIALEYVVQHNQTDLEFLRKRARLIGYEIYVRDKVLYFQPPQHAKPPAATLRIGEEIIEFTPRLQTLNQVADVSVRGWDMTKKQVLVGRASTGQEATLMGGKTSGPARTKRAFGKADAISVDVPVPSKAQADGMAVHRFNELALTFIQGEVECAGDPELQAGKVVSIQGAGDTFSGAYYITSVTHSVTPGEGYRTRLEVRRNAT
jgi:Bacteriophage probable baseplate hub protein